MEYDLVFKKEGNLIICNKMDKTKTLSEVNQTGNGKYYMISLTHAI